jgi:hypothetical protein
VNVHLTAERANVVTAWSGGCVHLKILRQLENSSSAAFSAAYETEPA